MDVAHIDCKAGDTLVVHCNERLTRAQADQIKAMFVESTSSDVHVIVIDATLVGLTVLKAS